MQNKSVTWQIQLTIKTVLPGLAILAPAAVKLLNEVPRIWTGNEFRR